MKKYFIITLSLLATTAVYSANYYELKPQDANMSQQNRDAKNKRAAAHKALFNTLPKNHVKKGRNNKIVRTNKYN